MKTARRNYLYISLTVFAVLLLVFIVDTVRSAIDSCNASCNETCYGEWWGWEILAIFIFKLPIPLAGLSLVKNGYILLTPTQHTVRKILCIVSSVIAILALIFVSLAEWKGNYMYHGEQKWIWNIWPHVILSFLLGASYGTKC